MACVAQDRRYLSQVIGHEDDVGTGEGQVGSDASHGDGHVGTRQRRGIVDPVANHRHPVSLFTQGLDHRRLLFR